MYDCETIDAQMALTDVGELGTISGGGRLGDSKEYKKLGEQISTLQSA